MSVRKQSSIVAFHEAGHAVMAMANRFQVIEISLGQDNTSLGRVEYRAPEPLIKADRMRSILVSASGMAADYINWKYLGGLDATEVVGGDNSDRMNAQNHLDIIGYPEAFEAFLSTAMAYLKRDAVWPLVDRIARLLLHSPSINDAKILESMSRSIPELGRAEWALLEEVLQQIDKGQWQLSHGAYRP